MGAVHTDTVLRTSVEAVFAVTPKDMRDFPPVLSMGVGYSVNGEPRTRVDIQKPDDNVQGRVTMTIYGKDIALKAPRLHARLNGACDAFDHPDVLFLALRFHDIATQPIVTMDIRYGLWEKRHRDLRIEEDFTLDLD